MSVERSPKEHDRDFSMNANVAEELKKSTDKDATSYINYIGKFSKKMALNFTKLEQLTSDYEERITQTMKELDEVKTENTKLKEQLREKKECAEDQLQEEDRQDRQANIEFMIKLDEIIRKMVTAPNKADKDKELFRDIMHQFTEFKKEFLSEESEFAGSGSADQVQGDTENPESADQTATAGCMRS